jgi:dihydroorotate dehydrogenase
MKLFISPPFGNYLGFLPGTTAIYGSYTLSARPGLFSQIRKTLHYSHENNGWINKIGLRNKGIDYMVGKWKKSIFSFIHRNNVVSIAILKHNDINCLLDKIPDDMNLEINISCPNTKEDLVKKDVQKFLNPKRKFCSVKCSPLTKPEDIDYFYELGFRTFHFSNTLPVPNGGLSGIALIPYTSFLTKYTRDKYGDEVYIISGGGVRNIEQVQKYEHFGCNAVSVSSLCFDPFKFVGLYFVFLRNYVFN